MDPSLFNPPIVQVAIDVLDIGHALRIAEAAVRAGVDWLEAGTPLITFCGTGCICAIAREFPGYPVLADYKAMDGVGKYFHEAAKQGGKLATVCGAAADASIRAAVKAGSEAGVAVVSDLYACADPPARARQIEALGADSVYVHWGADQRGQDPEHDPQEHLAAVIEAVRIPVGVGTFSVADGVRAFRTGAAISAIGVPLIQASDVEAALREFVLEAKAAYRSRA